MDIDDIYLAATGGDISELRKLLNSDEGKKILNVPIESDLDDGTKTKFSVLLSILAGMEENGFNMEVLNVLADAGIDVNIPVEVVYTNGKADVYPLAKKYMGNPHVLEWFLKNGANPNAVELIESPKGLVEDVPLMVWAIKENNERAVQLLLQYGADPSKPAHPLPVAGTQLQLLKPLYYSLLEVHNVNITAMLYKAGSYTDEHIDFTKKFGGYDTIGKFVQKDSRAMKVHGQALDLKDKIPDYEVKHIYDSTCEEKLVESSTIVRLKTLTRIDQKESQQITNKEIKKDNNKAVTRAFKKKCYIKFQAYLVFQGLMIGIALFFMCFLSEPSDRGLWIALTVVDWLLTIGLLSPTIILSSIYHCFLPEVLVNFFLDGLFIFLGVICCFMILLIPVGILLFAMNHRREEIHFKDQYGQDHYGYVDENNNFEDKYTGEKSKLYVDDGY